MPEKKTTRSAKAAPKAKAAVAPKAKKAPAKKPAARTAASKPAAPRRHQDGVEERIQRRAYELWEREGRPDGREHDHWLQAEREVSKARRQRIGAGR